MLAILAEDFYIVGVRRLIKYLSCKCVPCHKAYAQTQHQLMGQLPPERVTPTPPFTVTGVDFSGPFLLILGNPRKPVTVKAYVALFMCLSTKAVHLEVCIDLLSETFLAALRRFITRRGVAATIPCDNGKMFVVVSRELSANATLLQSNDFMHQISHFSAEYQVQWKFIPARAPYFGSLWETGVQSMKL